MVRGRRASMWRSGSPCHRLQVWLDEVETVGSAPTVVQRQRKRRRGWRCHPPARGGEVGVWRHLSGLMESWDRVVGRSFTASSGLCPARRARAGCAAARAEGAAAPPGEDEEAHAGATVVKTEEAGAHRIEAKRKEIASARRPRHGSVCHAWLERTTGRRRGAPRLSRQVEVDVVPGAARRACRV
jgi:hypothetical protein